MISLIKISVLAILLFTANAIAQPKETMFSWRHMLIPEVQEITDRIVELRWNYERGKERLPDDPSEEDIFYLGPPLFSESNRIEAISRYVVIRVLQEYNERAKIGLRTSADCIGFLCQPLSEKDLADMMYCRFSQSIGKCPRPEFLIVRRAR